METKNKFTFLKDNVTDNKVEEAPPPQESRPGDGEARKEKYFNN